MQDYLIILLPSQNEGALLWGRVRQNTLSQNGEISLSEIKSIVQKNEEICLVIPGQNVRTLEHSIPKMNRRERMNAVLFSIEESISAPLESIHLALKEGDHQTVSLIAKHFMQEIQDWAEAEGITLRKVVADYEALSSIGTSPISLSDRVVFAGSQGHTIDLDWYDGPINTVDPATLLTTFIDTIPETTNLLQGEFSPQSAFKDYVKPALQLGGLAAAFGLAALFLHGMQASSMASQAEDLRSQSAALYTQATGQAAPANLARVLLRQSQQSQRASTEFLSLNSLAFKALSGFEDVRIERLSYQNTRNEIQLRLVYPSFERAEAVQKAMKDAGGNFIPGGVREQNGRFVGEATLRLNSEAS